MKNSFDLALILEGQYREWLVNGFITSLRLTFYSLLFALPFSLFIALLRLSSYSIFRWMGASYVEIIRNIPLLVHLLFWYFAVPEVLPEQIKTALYARNIEFYSAAAGLTFYISAYMAEDIRSGIRSISKVQFEASRALGLSVAATYQKVILPQALRVTLPPLISQILNLWKSSSVATVIGVSELMYEAARVESASFRSAEAFTFVTTAYLAVSFIIIFLANLVGRTLNSTVDSTRKRSKVRPLLNEVRP